MPRKSTSGGGPRIPGGRKTLIWSSAIFGLTVVFVLLFSQQSLYKIYQLRQERNRLDRENARLLEENTRLARTIDRLHNDPEMIQDQIRRELNFVKKNEIIIQLPEAGRQRPQQAGMVPQPQAAAAKQGKAGSASPRQTKKKAPGASHRAP